MQHTKHALKHCCTTRYGLNDLERRGGGAGATALLVSTVVEVVFRWYPFYHPFLIFFSYSLEQRVEPRLFVDFFVSTLKRDLAENS